MTEREQVEGGEREVNEKEPRELLEGAKIGVRSVAGSVERIRAQLEGMTGGGPVDPESIRALADELEEVARSAEKSGEMARESARAFRREQASGDGVDIEVSDDEETSGRGSIADIRDEITGLAFGNWRSVLLLGAGVVGLVLTTAFSIKYLVDAAERREKARAEAREAGKWSAGHTLRRAAEANKLIEKWKAYDSAVAGEDWKAAAELIDKLSEAGLREVPRSREVRKNHVEALVGAAEKLVGDVSGSDADSRLEKTADAKKKLDAARSQLEKLNDASTLSERFTAVADKVERVRIQAKIDKAEELISRGDEVRREGKFGEAEHRYQEANKRLWRLSAPEELKPAVEKLKERSSSKKDSLQAKVDRRYERKLRGLRESEVEAGGVEVGIKRVRISSRWTFDRYDDRYNYLEADKNRRWVQVDFTVTSDSKDPTLPAFALYELGERKATSLGLGDVEFYRWSDYGAYLGNYHDNRNDFAKRDTVHFSAAVSIPESKADESMYLGLTTSGCLHRNRQRLEQPPVSYNRLGCSQPRRVDIPELFDKTVPVRTLNAGAVDLEQVDY